MRTSETITFIAPALYLARAAMPTLRKNGNNPDTNSKYVRFEDMVPAVRKALATQEILALQSATMHEEVVTVVTRFIHTGTGEWIEMDLSLPVAGRMMKGGARGAIDAQAGGSAITYARRYGLATAFFLVADEDDDGRAVVASQGQARRAAGRRQIDLEDEAQKKPEPTQAQRRMQQLERARAYVPGSFVMPGSADTLMTDQPRDVLDRLKAFAIRYKLTELGLDVDMAIRDLEKRNAAKG